MLDWEKLNRLNPTPPEGKVLVLGKPPTETEGYLVVGEAPGKEEVIAGEPFVGKAGQLLRKALDDWGVEPVYFTNACLWRPTDGSEDNVKPTTKEVLACLPRLWALIAWYKPRRILAVGAVAAAALFRFNKVIARRGMVKTIVVGGTIYEVWITHHPAYPLYEPDYWVDFYQDIGRFSRGERPDTSPTQHVQQIFAPAPTVAVDLEMTSPLPGQGQILCIAASGKPGEAVVSSDVGSVLSQIAGKSTIIGHNSIVDEVALRLAGYDLQFTEDTLLYHYAHDERKRTHSLKTLAPTIAGVATFEDLVAPYMHASEDDEEDGGLAAAPPDLLHAYNARDADATLRLWYALKAHYADSNWWLYRFLMEARKMLVEATLQGLSIDREALNAAIATQTEKVQAIRQSLPINPNSPEQVLSWLKQAGYRVNDTREDTLRRLDGPEPQKMLEYREESKVLDAFLIPLSEMGDVIRPSYQIHGTETGRLSCKDPNIQQFPERLKHLIVARPGKIFVGWDFNQLEIRVQAWLCRDPKMIEALREGVDFHQRTGELLGIDRQAAKRLNFLIQYGGGASKASRSLGISWNRAKALIENYYQMYAGLKAWKEDVTKLIIESGVLQTPYGRLRHFDFLTDDNLAEREREGHNFLVQSFSSDINLDVALEVYHRTGVPATLLVHDFAAFEIEERDLHDFVYVIEKAFHAVMNNQGAIVPFVLSVKAGKAWHPMTDFTATLVFRPGSPTA